MLTENLTIDEPKQALPEVALENLPPTLQEACARAGWSSLMPVQAHALPYLLKGRDLMVQSRTGSGKTGAYLLPLLKRLDFNINKVQSLVLVPTRELAMQVKREAEILFAASDTASNTASGTPGGPLLAAVYGGTGYNRQLEALRRGAALVIGTPGRILDHLLRKSLNLNELKNLIFDEADRMLSIGFYQDMKDIQRHLPKHPIQTTLFSATYPPHVLRLAEEFMYRPDMLSLSHSQVHVAEVEHMYCECKPMDKDRTLVRLIEVENPSSAIIFCNTKANVHYVAAVLQGFGLNAGELSADLSQSKREKTLEMVRKGNLRFLVATDVAARGIDIPELSHVFLYEPPEDKESYIHRAGRTGRAGSAGVVISLVDIMQKMELEKIAGFFKINLVPLPNPDDNEVSRVVGTRILTLLEGKLRQKTALDRERMLRFGPIIAQIAKEPEQLPLLELLLDETYQGFMHQSLVSPKSVPQTATGISADTGRVKAKAGYGRSNRNARNKRRNRGSASRAAGQSF